MPSVSLIPKVSLFQAACAELRQPLTFRKLTHDAPGFGLALQEGGRIASKRGRYTSAVCSLEMIAGVHTAHFKIRTQGSTGAFFGVVGEAFDPKHPDAFESEARWMLHGFDGRLAHGKRHSEWAGWGQQRGRRQAERGSDHSSGEAHGPGCCVGEGDVIGLRLDVDGGALAVSLNGVPPSANAYASPQPFDI